jgi:cytoskeletal protein CcmA (bactofilin family)
MTIKQLGGVFGRNPTFNNVTIEGTLTFDGDIDINSDLTIEDNLYVLGSVGIGNTSPATALDVTGTALAHEIEIGDGSAGGTSEILFSDNVSARGKILYDHSSNPETMLLQTTGTTAISIDNSQNISIPNGNLDVTGSVTADGLTVDGDAIVSGANPANSLLAQLSVKSTAALANGNASGISFWAQTSSGLGAYGSIQAVTTGDYAGKLVFTTRNGAGSFDPKMTIDASGSVAIGTTTPATGLHLSGANNVSSSLTLTNTAPTPDNTWTFVPQYNALELAVLNNGAERMRIDASGNLLVGKTSVSFATAGIELKNSNVISITRSANPVLNANRIGSSAGSLIIMHYDGVDVGSIDVTASATSYTTSSDQRLKENIADADDAGSKIDAIQVRKFDWKVDGSHQDYGMVAQELLEVAPEAVSVPEDPEEMMGVDYSKLVPMMLKEIQSLRARVAQLEP